MRTFCTNVCNTKLVKTLIAALAAFVVSISAWSQETYYLFRSGGSWFDATTWTTDPSSATLVNPNGVVPGMNGAKVNVVIPASKTVVADFSKNNKKNSISVASIQLAGSIECSNVQNFSFDDLTGEGVLALNDYNADKCPLRNFSGTLALNANGSITLNNFQGPSLEVRSGIVVADDVLALTGKLTVNTGATLKLGSNIYAELNDVDVYGSLLCESFSSNQELVVKGSIRNYGTIDLAESQTSGLPLIMRGTGNSDFIIDGDKTELYQLVCDMGAGRVLNVHTTTSGTDKIQAIAQTYDVADYKKLPWYPKSGTLKLGQGVKITEWGIGGSVQENGHYNTVDVLGNHPNMVVPEDATLHIAGANISVGDRRTSPNSWDPIQVGQVIVRGELKVSAGTLTLSERAWGVIFNNEHGMAKMTVEGGTVRTPRLVCLNNNNKASYSQTGGLVDLYGGISSPNGTSNIQATYNLYMGTGSEFNMSGGEILISRNAVSSVNHGEYKVMLTGFDGHPSNWDPSYQLSSSVTGGKITFASGGEIGMFVPNIIFYDVDIKKGTKVLLHESWNQNVESNLTIGNNLNISEGSKLDLKKHTLTIGRNLQLSQNSVLDKTEPSSIIFNGTANATYSVHANNVSWNNVTVSKGGNAKVTIDQNGQPLRVNGGNIQGRSGSLVGNMYILGASTITDKVKTFAQTNVYVQGADLTVNSDVEFNYVKLSPRRKVMLGMNNCKVLTKVDVEYTGGTIFNPQSVQMFEVANVSASRGLTLPIDNANTLFPVGVNGKYAPVTVMYGAQGKFVTVVPINNTHPAVDTKVDGKLLMPSYYWKIYSDVADDGATANVYKATLPEIDNNLSASKSFYPYVNSRATGEWTKAGDQALNMGEIIGSNIGGYFTGKGKEITFKTSVLTGDYAVGAEDCFVGNEVQTYISIKDGDWKDKIWRKLKESEICGGDKIKENDKVVVQHHVSTENGKKNKDHAIAAGLIEISKGGIMEFNQLAEGTAIRAFAGNGKLVFNLEDVEDIRAKLGAKGTDFTDFCGNSEAIMIINNTSANEKQLWSGDYFGGIYPNVIFQGSPISAQANNLAVKVNGYIRFENQFHLKTYNGNLDVAGDFIVANDSKFTSTPNSTSMNITINGDVVVGNNAQMLTSDDNGSGLSLNIVGDIKNDGTIKLGTQSATRFIANSGADVPVRVYGSATQYGSTYLGNICIEKDVPHAVVSFNIPVGTAEAYVPVKLEQGALRLNYPANGKITTLRKVIESSYSWVIDNKFSGANDFDVPTGAALQVYNGGTARVYVSDTDKCLTLSGTISLAGNSKMVVNTALSGGNNADGYSGIKYTAGPSSTINLTNSQIDLAWLSPSSPASPININTTGASVINILAGQSVSNGGMGLFDIRDGDVILSGQTVVNINNSTTQAAIPTLFYSPSTSLLSKGAKINISNAGSGFSASADKPLCSVEIAGTEVAMATPIEVAGTLQIDNGASLRSQNNNLTIGGNFFINGTYSAGSNLTMFNGTETQVLSGTGNKKIFNNVKIDAKKVESDANVDVNGNFELYRGELNQKGYRFAVNGSASVMKNAVVSGDGELVLNGASGQKLFCEGSIHNLTLENNGSVSAGQHQAYPINITGRLTLGRTLDISSNTLNMASGAAFAGNFGTSAMVQTNGSVTDGGISIEMSEGKAYNVVVPIGTHGKYTPATLSNVTTSAAGSIRLAVVNEVHPSVAGFSGYNGNALQYYWTLRASGVEVANGSSISLKAVPADAVGYPNDNYATAVLLSDGNWRKVVGDVTGNVDLNFPLLGSAQNIDGDYTAGISGELPDKLLTYISVADGNWGSRQTWEKYENGQKTPIAQKEFNMRGVAVIVEHNVTMGNKDNGQRVCKVDIAEAGKLDAGTTYNNNFGKVNGKGTLVVKSANSMPAADYTNFFSADGGTIEYGGATDYNVFVNHAAANNVIFSGSGKRTLRSDIDVVAFGNATVKDQAEVVFASRDLRLNGNITISGGTMSGSGELVFEGTKQQAINAGAAELPGIMLKNASGVTSHADITVKSATFESGILLVDALTVKESISGGSATSYVDGKLTMNLLAGKESIFPIGDGDRYALTSVVPQSNGSWSVEYFSSQPVEPIDGTTVKSIGNEHWTVMGPANASARVRLRWDEQSGGFSSVTKVLTYESTAWKVVEHTNREGDENAGSVLAQALITNMSGQPRKYAFGTAENLPPFVWTGINSADWSDKQNWSNKVLPTAVDDVTITSSCDNTPLISQTANVRKITLQENATLRVAGSQARLNVVDIANNGEVELVYAHDASPSVVVTGEVTGNKVKVVRSFMANRLYYVGSATSEGALSGMGVNDRLTHFDAAAQAFSPLSGNAFGGSSQLFSAGTLGLRGDKGAVLSVTQVGTIQKVANVAGNIVSEKWNWLCNPYPFVVDLSKFIVDAAQTEGMETVWVRTFSGSSYTYCTVNTATKTVLKGDGSMSLAPFQAFCVKPMANTITLNGRSIAATSTTLKSGEVINDELRIRVTSDDKPTVFDEMALVFRGGSLMPMSIDSEKYPGESFTMVCTSKPGGKNTAISVLPSLADMTELDMIPVVVSPTANASTISISASNIDVFDNTKRVVLIDNKLGVETDLREEAVYIVENADITPDRFAICLKSTETDGGTETGIGSLSAGKIAIYASGSTVVVNANADGGTAVVYDMAGNAVKRQPLNVGRTEFSIDMPGVYVVEAVTDTATKRGKVCVM